MSRISKTAFNEALLFVYEEAAIAEKRAEEARKCGGRLDRETEIRFQAKADGMRIAASAMQARLNP